MSRRIIKMRAKKGRKSLSEEKKQDFSPKNPSHYFLNPREPLTKPFLVFRRDRYYGV